MSIRYLDLSGAVNFWTNIKNYILSKIPTKTSELTNDSGYITNTDTCLHKSGGETFTGYKTVENINSGLIFKSTDYQAEIRLSGTEPYDVSIVSKNLANNTYSYYTLMDRYGNVFPGIYRPRASNLTVYVSNTASNNDGDGLTANTAFSYSALRNFLGAIRMQSGSSLGGTYSLTVNLIPTGTSYGTCRFDSTKMPYVKNLVIQTSTGIEGTPENYTTNCPDLSQLYISGNMDVTVRNIKCGEIAVYQGAKVTLTNFNAVGQVRADNNGYVIVGGYLYVFYYPLSTSPRASLFDASLDGHIRIESANTTINFSEQVYYTAGVLRTINHGYMYANISRWKLLGIKPCVIGGSSTTVLTTCSTPGNVSSKTVETGTTIGTSSVIGVTFSETNTADNPTLNVNGLGDWPIVADTNAVDIKHYLPFGVRIIFKRSRNTWKITNTKDVLQNIAGDCSMYVSGNLGTTYNNGEFNFGDYIVAQSTSSTNTGIYNAVQYNINGTNIFDGIRTITQPWVYTATQSIKLTTTLGGTVYQDKGIKFTDNNSASIGYLYGCTFNNGGSGVGISTSNVIDNTTVSKGVRVVLTNDGKSYLYPGNPNDTSLGSEYFTWKGVYANKYYLGSTEFGDIVTHNASEFLTQHQSLANYATKQDLADLVNSAPSTLDTLNELASALGNDPNFATTVSTQIGNKANDNTVVHKSGNETVDGIKTFSNNTYITSLNFTNEVESQSSSSSAVLPVVTTVTYADQSPSQTARLNFRITANGDKSLYPHENNQYSFGVASRRWATLYGYLANLGGTYVGNEASANERTNLYLLSNRDTDGQSGAYIGRFRQNRAQGAMSGGDVSFIGFDFLENSTRYTRCFTMGLTDWDSNGVPQTYYLTSPDGKGSLGTATTAWNKVYANSYYLGTTSFTDKFVTTDTAQTITGVKTLNSDTLVANQGNAYRIANSDGTGYGVLQRMDGTYWYMLVTANNDPLGTWTSARPITIRLSDGYCTINGKANEANKVYTTIAADTTTALVQASVASNDCFRIAAGGAANAGWAEIATGDDANEPIYVRQYKGAFTTLQRTATLLDGSGNTSFPGTVTATGFSGALSGNASSATEFSANKNVTLTGDVTGTASSKAGWSIATTLTNSGVTAGTYGPSADVTGSNNATILVPEITVDAKGRVTSVTNRTYTSVNTDTNTDTKVTQTVTTGNSTYPVLLCATANATETGTTTSRFSAGLTVNTRYSSIYMTNKYDTTNTKGVRNTASYSNGILYFRSYDNTQMGLIRCDSHKSGYQHIYMQASNYIKDGAINPEGTATTCSIAVRVRDNGSKTIYTEGSWENSLTPYANETYNLGTSSLRWMDCYCKNFYGSYVDIAGKCIGNEFSTNARTCLYLKSNRDTDGKSGIYFSKYRQNVAQGALTGSNLVSLTLDVLENSVRTNDCIAIQFRYFENDVPTKIYVIPKASATSYMGTADNPWTNAYITNLNLNGAAFDPTSIDGIGTTRLLAYEPASTSDLSNPAGTTKSGSALYDVRMELNNANESSGIFDSRSGGTFSVTIDKNRTQPGTWKVLHYISAGWRQTGLHSFAIAMWVRIA